MCAAIRNSLRTPDLSRCCIDRARVILKPENDETTGYHVNTSTAMPSNFFSTIFVGYARVTLFFVKHHTDWTLRTSLKAETELI